MTLSQVWNALKKPYAVAMGTALVVSSVWLFFYSKMIDLKDERIKAQEEEIQRISRIAAIPDTIEKLDSRLSAAERRIRIYDSAFPSDELTGRMVLGHNMGAATSLTLILSDAQDLIVARKFDLAEQKIEELDRLVPGFTGALFARWQIAASKGYSDDAILYGEQVLKRLPKDERVKPVYENVIALHLQKNQQKKAEEIALAMVRGFPSDTNAAQRFQGTFGYTASTNSP